MLYTELTPEYIRLLSNPIHVKKDSMRGCHKKQVDKGTLISVVFLLQINSGTIVDH